MLHFDVLYLGIFHRWVDFRRQVSVERRYDFGMIAHYTEWRLRLCSESLFPEDCIPGRKVKTLQLLWSTCHDFKLMFCIGWLGNVLASRGRMKEFLIGSPVWNYQPLCFNCGNIHTKKLFRRKSFGVIRVVKKSLWLDKGGQERPPRTLPLDPPLESFKTHVQSHCSAH